MLSSEIIYNELVNINTALQKKYDEKYIFGVFVIGMANYNLAEIPAELEYIMIKLPTFEELCLSIPQVYFDEDFPNVKIVDWKAFYQYAIQVFYQYSIQQNNMIMQCMFTDYYIVNPRYSKYYETQMKPQAELIYSSYKKKRLQSMQQMALELLEECELDGKLTGLNAMEAARLSIVIDLYAHGTPYGDCIKLNKATHVQYLLGIKNGIIIIEIDKIKEEMEKALQLVDNVYNKKANDAIQKIIIDILQMSITKDVDANEFLQTLTAKEKIALECLVSSLDEGEGNVSIVKMVDKAGVSRPVFMGLIQKMKDHKIAEIKNMGVKGTYFHIFNQRLIS